MARARALVSTTQGQQASASSGAAPPVVSSAAAETTTLRIPVGDGTSTRQADFVPMENVEGPTVVHKPQPAAPPGKHVVKHRDSTPKCGNSLVRNADAVEAVPDRKKTRHIAGIQVCAVNSI